MDSGFSNSRVIDAVRSVGIDFLIQAELKGEIQKLVENAVDGEPATATGVKYSDYAVANRPNAFAAPIDSTQLGAGRRGYDHTPFFTDLNVEERDVTGLAYQYRNRWGLETAIREIKNRFHAPTQSSDRVVRAWYFSTAALFYNLHTLLSRHSYPLGQPGAAFTGVETLHALRHTSFDR